MANRTLDMFLDSIFGKYGKRITDPDIVRQGAAAAMQPVTSLPKAGEMVQFPGIPQQKVTKEILDPQGYGAVGLTRPVEAYTPTTVPTNIPNLQRRTVGLEDLQDGVLIPLYGDRMAGGEIVTKVGDIPLSTGKLLEGGTDYMLGGAQQFDKAGWASAPHIVDLLAGAAGRDYGGRDVYGVTFSMAPNALDFNATTGRVAADLIQQTDMPKAGVQMFNQRLAKITDGRFPGLLSDELDEFLLYAKPDDRKAFLRTLDSKQYGKDLGLPTDAVAAARYAVTNASQRDLPSGRGGAGIIKIDLDELKRMENQQFPHSTYSAQLLGDYVGELDFRYPEEILFPEAFGRYNYFGDAKGNVMQAPNKTYAMKTQLPGQIVDQPMIDAARRYQFGAVQPGLLSMGTPY